MHLPAPATQHPSAIDAGGRTWKISAQRKAAGLCWHQMNPSCRPSRTAFHTRSGKGKAASRVCWYLYGLPTWSRIQAGCRSPPVTPGRFLKMVPQSTASTPAPVSALTWWMRAGWVLWPPHWQVPRSQPEWTAEKWTNFIAGLSESRTKSVAPTATGTRERTLAVADLQHHDFWKNCAKGAGLRQHSF